MRVGPCRRQSEAAAAARGDRAHRLRGAAKRRFRNLRGMGIGGGLAGDRAHPESAPGVETRLFEAPIVENERLRAPVLKEDLTILGADERGVEDGPGTLGRDPGAVEKARGAAIRHRTFRIGWRSIVIRYKPPRARWKVAWGAGFRAGPRSLRRIPQATREFRCPPPGSGK